MEILCDTNYILLPASDNAQNKRLYFYIDNELVYDLVVRLDNNTPDYHRLSIFALIKPKKSVLNMTVNTDRWCILQPPRVG